ncbi:MAG: hypothetical protein GAK28_04891 [Luteibacter sp.]|uniref:hypothetical protein n=1 Tax=Luteibacter sp. TaxID=1886636 RepID=UPI001382BEE0|nr:hypothetical protein [Luteibacter sp.]KAF1003154.1 MAG: hypothetical protein GAK28_04891 [Luteibacter sp.]
MARFDEDLYAAWAASEATLYNTLRELGPGALPNALNELAELKLEANRRFMDLWTAGAAPPSTAGVAASR